jgi:hypothetical protein
MAKEGLDQSSLKLRNSDSGLWSTFNDQEIKLKVVVSEQDVRLCSVMPETESVLDLKIKLFAAEMRADKRIRLIYQGKILLDSYKLALYSSVHTEIADKDTIHCAISKAPIIEEEPNYSPDIRGLDKLFDLGYSSEEISGLRYHFHMMCKHIGSHRHCTRREQLVDLEEAYLRGMLPAVNLEPSERLELEMERLEIEGDGFDLLWGVLFGVLLNLLALVLVRAKQPKVLRLSMFQRLGLRAGLLVSLALMLFGLYYLSSPK